MSTTAIPKYSIPGRKKDPIQMVMGNGVASKLSRMLRKTKDFKVLYDIFDEYKNTLIETSNNFLDAKDEYLNNVANNVWDDFSVWTGNTRGSLKYVGKYPMTELEFDKEEWFRPKILTNLVPRSVTVSWDVKGSKHHPKKETHTKTYNYAPGSLKVRITGEDYAPRIPSPPHGGGKIDMLVAVFEEMRDAEWNKIANKRGI